MRRVSLFFVVVIFTLSCTNKKKISDTTVTGLRCDYTENPLGIDNRTPKLSWIINSATSNQTQSAYQILVSSKPELLNTDNGNFWDTGKTKSCKLKISEAADNSRLIFRIFHLLPANQASITK